jgi:hypothetical protein
LRDFCIVEYAIVERTDFALAFEHVLVHPVHERLRFPCIEAVLHVLKVATADVALIVNLRTHHITSMGRVSVAAVVDALPRKPDREWDGR